MRYPTPSPKGTNLEGLYTSFPTKPIGAYDAVTRRRIARDQEPEYTADNFLKIVYFLCTKLPSEECDQFVEGLKEITDGGSVEQWLESNRPAQDQPPPFSGRPRPGGEMDPIRQAQDRKPRHLVDEFGRRYGFDLYGAPIKSPPTVKSSRSSGFTRMFPNASRIKVV